MSAGALTIYSAEDVKFVSGEPVKEYVEDLSRKEIHKLEYMTFEHERNAMIRYMNMYNEYFAGTASFVLSAQSFASPAFVKQFAKDYAEADDLEDNAKAMSSTQSRNILHFLYTYYYSYHEAEEALKRRVKLVSFSTWFHRLRVRLARKMKKEMEAEEKAYNQLDGNRLEAYTRNLRDGKRKWVHKWTRNASSAEKLREMKHVVLARELGRESWRRVFKVSGNSDASSTRREVLRKFRSWSIFMHPDQNRGFGLPFQNRLRGRLSMLEEKRTEMETWYAGLARS